MPNKNQLLRYLIIYELLRNRQHKFPTKERIIETIQERTDTDYSVSAFEKDLKIMREQFGAPIEFHNLERGYFYGYKQKNKRGEIHYEIDREYRFMSISLSQKDLVALNFAESILQSFKNSQIFEDFSDAINKVLDAVEVGNSKIRPAKCTILFNPKMLLIPKEENGWGIFYGLLRITNKLSLPIKNLCKKKRSQEFCTLICLKSLREGGM